MNEFPESDWKLLRELQPVALERLCSRILSQVSRQCDSTGQTSHQRYLKVFSLVEEGDHDIARAFNNPRRSAAFMRLTAMRSQGLITDGELLRFTAATRSRIKALEGGAR